MASPREEVFTCVSQDEFNLEADWARVMSDYPEVPGSEVNENEKSTEGLTNRQKLAIAFVSKWAITFGLIAYGTMGPAGPAVVAACHHAATVASSGT